MRQLFYYDMRLFYYKMRQKLITNVSGVSLHMQLFYCKMSQLLQNATVLLHNATVTTKCDVYYKMRRYN